MFVKTKTAIIIGGLLLSLSACKQNAEPTAPKTEAEALSRFEAAKQDLAKFRECPQDQILSDVSSYDADWPREYEDQQSWFDANGKREGVVTTASGLQYKINKKSNIKANPPKPTQKVRVNYHGVFIDGKKFDSSYERGQDISFPLNGVIKGWTEGVGLMRPCDAWTFYIPSDLAYGDNGRGSIPPKTPLIFHVQLLGIED